MYGLVPHLSYGWIETCLCPIQKNNLSSLISFAGSVDFTSPSKMREPSASSPVTGTNTRALPTKKILASNLLVTSTPSLWQTFRNSIFYAPDSPANHSPLLGFLKKSALAESMDSKMKNKGISSFL